MRLFIDHSIINSEKWETCEEIKKKVCVSNERELFLLMTMLVEEFIRGKNGELLVLTFTYKVGEYAVSTVSYLNGRVVSLIQKNILREEQIDLMIKQEVAELLVVFSMKTEYAQMLYEKYKNKAHDRIRERLVKQCAECGAVYISRGNDKICKNCYLKREERYVEDAEAAAFKKCLGMLTKEMQNKHKFANEVYENVDTSKRTVNSLKTQSDAFTKL